MHHAHRFAGPTTQGQRPVTEPTVRETQGTLRLVVLALVVLGLGLAAVCGLRPRTAVRVGVELPPKRGPEIRSCSRVELLHVASRPPGEGDSYPKSRVWNSAPGSLRLIGLPGPSCDRSIGLSG